MNFEKKKILITVKAYPNPSKKYGETVCCAGIDISNGQWIRLYPIPFRDLDNEKQFKKYSIIKVDCSKPTDDKRPESYHVQADSIEVLEVWDTKNKWERRKSVVLPTLSTSMCEVYREAKEHDKSLALIKPRDISFDWKRTNPKDEQSRESCYAQLSFFDKKKNAVEEIPYDFYYLFKCDGVSDCPSHKLSIIDWEIAQAYRDWRWKYKPEVKLLEKIRERWLDRMCLKNTDVYFFVGNLKRFRETFMVLGTFYPPKQ